MSIPFVHKLHNLKEILQKRGGLKDGKRESSG
jgi:hypothetical protein